MTDQIDNHLVTQFSEQVHIDAQQVKSRFRDKVIIKMVEGEDYAYDGLGDSGDAVEILSRHQKTVADDIAHNRRRIRMREFRKTFLLDKKDDLETLINPQSEYSMATARSLFKKFDAIAAEAAFATVNTGKDFGTSVTYATDGGRTVDATSGVTYAKLLEIHENWINDDVGNDLPEEFYFALSGEEHTDLMGETNLISGDFTRQFAVEKGSIVNAAGLDIIKFAKNAPTPILDVNSGTRDCIAATNRGICVGISQELDIEVSTRGDLNNATQVQAVMMMGAVRTEGALVQKVQTTSA